MIDADDGFLVENADLGFEGVDMLARVINFRGNGVLADRDAGGGGVDELDRLVGELAGGDVAGGEFHAGFDGFIEDLNFVMFFEAGGDAAHHEDRLVLIGLIDLDDLEAAGRGAGSFSMCFLYSSQVVAATVPRRRCRGQGAEFQELCGIARTGPRRLHP